MVVVKRKKIQPLRPYNNNLETIKRADLSQSRRSGTIIETEDIIEAGFFLGSERVR